MTMEKIAQELPNHGEVSDGDSWETMKNRSGSGKKHVLFLSGSINMVGVHFFHEHLS